MKKTVIISLLTIMLSVSAVFSGVPDKKLHKEAIYPTMKVVLKNKGGSGTAFVVRSEKIGEEGYLIALFLQRSGDSDNGADAVTAGRDRHGAVFFDWQRLPQRTDQMLNLIAGFS